MSINNQTSLKKKIFENPAPNPYLPLMKSLSIPKIADLSIVHRQSQLEASGQFIHEISQLCPTDLEQFLILFRQPQQINLNVVNSSAVQSSQQQQYYEQLEHEGEKLRIKLKQDAHLVHSIIEKHNRMKNNKQKCVDQMSNCILQIQQSNRISKYSELNKSIKYNFNQLESLLLEFSDVHTEAITFLKVMSVSQSNLGNSRLLMVQAQSLEVNESEFISTSMQLFSQLELHAKEFEQTISEKKRIMHISENYYQYKQVCQGLIELIQKYPAFEESKISQLCKLESLASVYFNHFQKSIQEQMTHYTSIIEQIRLSLSVIDKMKYLLSQAKEIDCQSERFLSLESQLTGDKLLISKTQNSYRLIQSYKRQFESIDINHYQHFNILRQKIYTKCFMEFDKIQFDIKQTVTISKDILDYIQQYQLFVNQNYNDMIMNVIQNLQKQLTKTTWQHLINLYYELIQGKQKLQQIQQNVYDIKYENGALDRLKYRFNKLITKELDTIEAVHPQIQQYLIIQDIDAQIEYEKFLVDYNIAVSQVNPIMNMIQNNLSTYIDIEDIELQNQKKTDLKRNFDILIRLEPSVKRLSRKKIAGNFKSIKQQFEGYLIFEKDTISFLETIQYLHQGNLYSILDDFTENNSQKHDSVICQLMELAQESIKRISQISHQSLLEVKEQQLRQFQWIWVFFQQLENFRFTLNTFITSNQQQKISLNQYLQFQKEQKFSRLFYQLAKSNKKVCPFWQQIQFELAKVSFKAFLIYIPKLLDNVSLVNTKQPLTQMQFDNENCAIVLEFLQSENTSKLAKYICMQQIYRKMKQISLDQIDSFQQVKQYFQNMEFEREEIDDIGVKFIQRIIFSDSNKKEEEMYALIQEEWILDYLEKGEIFFLQDLINQEEIFDKSQMIITPALQKIVKMHMEQSINWRNIRQILKQQQ